MFFSNAAPLPHFLAQSVQQRPMTLPLWRTVTLVSTLWSVITGHILLTGFFSWTAAAREMPRAAARRAIERRFISRSFWWFARLYAGPPFRVSCLVVPDVRYSGP